MRTLPAALLAAQRNASAVPYVKLEVTDRLAGVPRLRWERLYTGSEDDYHHAVTMPADGSLIRTRVSAANVLYLQRVISPGPSSDFSAWTSLGGVSDASGVALTSLGTTVLLFYVDTDRRTIKVKESTNSGQSFGSAVTVLTAASDVGRLAAGVNASGVVALFFTLAATVYVVKRTSGSWGSPSAWTNSVAGITGLVCVYNLDWDIALTGTDADGNAHLWTCLYGDGFGQSTDTWSSLTSIALASSGSDVEFHTPFLSCADVYRLFFIEKYTGDISYTRPYWSHTTSFSDYADALWREPQPFDLTSSYGVAPTHGGDYAWLSAPSGVWRSPLAPDILDISDDLLELHMDSHPFRGGLTLALRNDDGRFSDPAMPLNLGGEVRVSLGYHTTEGNLASAGPSYWITAWEHRTGPSEARVVVHAADGWALLDAWRARQQFAWPPDQRNIYQHLAFLFARAGLDLTSSSFSSTLVDHYPAFAINPGDSGLRAVQRLLDMVPDWIFIEGSRGYLNNPLSEDTSVYGYGVDHPIFEAVHRSAPSGIGHVQVYGKGIYGEGFHWKEAEGGFGRVAKVLDSSLDTDALAGDRAATTLRRAEVEASSGSILVPVNCGQQPNDVIDITDLRTGLNQSVRRVLGLELTYTRTTHARYHLRLHLGGV